jgi:hypothetical protein
MLYVATYSLLRTACPRDKKIASFFYKKNRFFPAVKL